MWQFQLSAGGVRVMNRRLAAALIAVLAPTAGFACLWDHDTLAMERSRFPSALELITGKFLRHSPEFYEWRIRDRLAKLEKEPENLAYLDDLAVAYDKTGHDDKAIETILKKEKIKPGLYETYANLGTFYIHSGRLEQGVEYIDKALAINPDAHFGREKYQKLLVQYVASKRTNGISALPLSPEPGDVFHLIGFADFIKASGGEWNARERTAAIKGILGIMRFGKHDSPIVLEALADLLRARAPGTNDAAIGENSMLLAARAYLMASYNVQEPVARQAYRSRSEILLALQQHDQRTLAKLEPIFQRELEEANNWYDELRRQEMSWIRDGQDAERQFDRLFAAEPSAIADRTQPEDPNQIQIIDEAPLTEFQLSMIAVLVVVLAVFLVIAIAFDRRKTRQA